MKISAFLILFTYKNYMIICKCYKCYTDTNDFILIKVDNNYQSICTECFEKKGCFMHLFMFLKNLFCCFRKTGKEINHSHSTLQAFK
jgi:hypothetical protein